MVGQILTNILNYYSNITDNGKYTAFSVKSLVWEIRRWFLFIVLQWWGLGSVCSFEIHENWHSDYNQRIAVNLYILRGSTLERLRALGLVGEELRESKPGGRRFQIWGFVAPFLHNWLLYFLGVSLGINTDLLRNFDTVWLLDEPEDMGD